MCEEEELRIIKIECEDGSSMSRKIRSKKAVD